jgi:hypothetical protein
MFTSRRRAQPAAAVGVRSPLPQTLGSGRGVPQAVFLARSALLPFETRP